MNTNVKDRLARTLFLLRSVRDGTVKSRANAIWAPLAQDDLVYWTSKTNGKIDQLALTVTGESFLRVHEKPKMP